MLYVMFFISLMWIIKSKTENIMNSYFLRNHTENGKNLFAKLHQDTNISNRVIQVINLSVSVLQNHIKCRTNLHLKVSSLKV